MKIRITFLIAVVALATTGATAQEADASRVKILPAAKPGALKLHYAMSVEEPIEVRFFDGGRSTMTDLITTEDAPNGISKVYDVTSISSADFRMQIRTSSMDLIYYIVPYDDGRKFTPYLEKVTYNYQAMVKADN